MFGFIKRRLQDISTIKALCSAAERHANTDGRKAPGAEHFVLASFDLPDGSAAGVFARLGVSPSEFRAAVVGQYEDALRSVGIDAPGPDARPVAASAGVYNAQPSGQALMQALSAQDKGDAPLLGAHVLLAASTASHGVVPRALRRMGIEPARLAEAARTELASAALAA